MKRLTFPFILTALLLTSTSLFAGVRVYVQVGPPVPPHEVVAVAPGPGFVWVPGYYRWSGTAYVWAPGRYLRPPRPHAVWVAPHWVHHQRGWYVVEGHWR